MRSKDARTVKHVRCAQAASVITNLQNVPPAGQKCPKKTMFGTRSPKTRFKLSRVVFALFTQNPRGEHIASLVRSLFARNAGLQKVTWVIR